VETCVVDDEAQLDGAFRPKTNSDDDHFSCSRQWTAAALPRQFSNQHACIHLILIPIAQNFVLSRCIALPRGTAVKEVGFYGDDGKSTLFTGKEIGHGREGRQALGVLLQNGSEQQLWLLRYDQIQFEVISTTCDLSGLEARLDSAVNVTRKSNEEEDDDEGDPDLIRARSK